MANPLTLEYSYAMETAIRLFFPLVLASITFNCSAETSLLAAEPPLLETAPIFNEEDCKSPDLVISKKQYSHWNLTITLIQVNG